MKILLSVHLYPPQHCAGAEMMIHDIAQYLISQGHEVKAIVHFQWERYEYEGVEVFPSFYWEPLLRWTDVVFTHLDMTVQTMDNAEGKPVFHLIHNDIPYQQLITANPKNNGVIYNSKWIANTLKYDLPSIVVHPPCNFEYNGTPKGDHITIINTSKAKGIQIFYRAALKLTDRKFLAVKGAYGDQLEYRANNVEVHEHTNDIVSIYNRTRILLMPSHYESWGKCAREAMMMGIPVICTPTPGLKENCGKAGIYCSFHRSKEWIEAIKSLDFPDTYAAQSRKVYEHAIQTNTMSELNQLDEFIQKLLPKKD